MTTRLLVAAALACCAAAQPAAQTPPLPAGARVHRDLAYVERGHERQKLDLYLPGTGRNWPLIVWVHGGAWLAGSKEGGAGLPYLRAGFAVASINYRLSQHAVFPAQIEDCKAAVRWLRAHAARYGYDPARIGAAGASAGGHLVALLGTAGETRQFDVGAHLDQSSRVQAVADFFGPTDFLQMDAHRPPGATLSHDAPNSPEARLLGGPIREKQREAARANPITYVSKETPPFLIVHGDRDATVPHHQSELLLAALWQAGAQADLVTVKDGPHGGRTVQEGVPRAVAFFTEVLKP